MQAKTEQIIDVVLDKAKEDGRILCEVAIAEVRTIGEKNYVIKVEDGFLRLKKGECEVVGITRATIIPERYKDVILSGIESNSKEMPVAYSYQKALTEAIEEQKKFVKFLEEMPDDMKDLFKFVDEAIKGAATEEPKKEGGEAKVNKQRAEEIAAEIAERLKSFLG